MVMGSLWACMQTKITERNGMNHEGRALRSSDREWRVHHEDKVDNRCFGQSEIIWTCRLRCPWDGHSRSTGDWAAGHRGGV